MAKTMLGAVLLAAAGGAAAAGNCEPIRDGIEARIRAGGVTQFTLTIVDADANVPGRNVGSCERGTKKIVYLQGSAAAPSTPKPAPKNDAVVTECKDGRVTLGGDCRKPAR
jgi:hypothetical protein